MFALKIPANLVASTSEASSACDIKAKKDLGNSTKEEIVENLLFTDLGCKTNSELGQLVVQTYVEDEKILNCNLDNLEKLNRVRSIYSFTNENIVAFGTNFCFSDVERLNVIFACFSQQTKEKAMEKMYGKISRLLLDFSNFYEQFSEFLTNNSPRLAGANTNSKLLIQLSHSNFQVLNNGGELKISDEQTNERLFVVSATPKEHFSYETSRLVNMLHLKINEEVSTAKQNYSFIALYFSFALFGNFKSEIFQEVLDARFKEFNPKILRLVNSKNKFESMIRGGMTPLSGDSKETIIHNLETFEWLAWKDEAERKTFASFFARIPLRIVAQDHYLLCVPRRLYEPSFCHPVFNDHGYIFSHCLPMLRSFSLMPFVHSEDILDEFILCHSRIIKNALESFFKLEEESSSILHEIERFSRRKGKRFFDFSKHRLLQIEMLVLSIRGYEDPELDEIHEKEQEEQKEEKVTEEVEVVTSEKKIKNKTTPTTVGKKNTAKERLAARLSKQKEEKVFSFKRQPGLFNAHVISVRVTDVDELNSLDEVYNCITSYIKIDLGNALRRSEIRGRISKPHKTNIGVNLTISKLLCSSKETVDTSFPSSRDEFKVIYKKLGGALVT